MNMMYINQGHGFGIMLGLHALGCLAFSLGILFLIFWAFKHLGEKQLKKWGWTLVIVGAVLCLFTFALGGNMRGGMGKMKFTTKMDHGMMMDSQGSPTMGGDGMAMSMKGMTMMLDGKTGDEFDAAFLAMMIPHHQGAIDMAKLVLKNAKHEELKTLANAIIAAQQMEIDQMQAWQTAWGYDQ